MKYKSIIFILFLVSVVNQISFGQCNVSTDVLDDGTKYFMHAKEKLYKNEDLENGILAAWIQIVVMQHPTDKDLLQFVIRVDVGKSGSQKMVVPRQMNISFTDGSSIDMKAESLESPRMEIGVYMQQSTFRLTTDYYTTLQTKSISKIVIIDNREETQLECTPYKDLLKEQANCIASKLN